jgi:hypothetical protein
VAWLRSVANTDYFSDIREIGYCECFHSKLREEFLNGEIFYSLKELQVLPRALACSRQHDPSALITRLSFTGTRDVATRTQNRVWRSGIPRSTCHSRMQFLRLRL